MSSYIATDTDLTAVANAIRAKGGTSAALEFPGGFVDAIGAISAGSASAAASDVNFIDYDGTILHSYTAQEFAGLSAMPANPSHSGLTAQGWNWALADAKAYVAKYGKLWIGQMYITNDGKTRVYIRLEKGRTSPVLSLAVNGSVDVDWGDGTEHSVVTGSSVGTNTYTPHSYSDAGDYVILLDVTGSASIQVSQSGSSDKRRLLCKNIQSGNSLEHYVYGEAIRKVEIGANMTLGARAFQFCYALSGITIPYGVTSIGEEAFYYCHSLRSVTIPDGVTSIGGEAFYSCYSLSSIAIPGSATSVNNGFVKNCYSLSSVAIPDGVTSIQWESFYYCWGLSHVVIPDSVTSIGWDAFHSCSGAGFIRFTSVTPPSIVDSGVFSRIASDVKIIVPYSADHSVLNAYKAATNYPDPTVYTYEEAAA